MQGVLGNIWKRPIGLKHQWFFYLGLVDEWGDSKNETSLCGGKIYVCKKGKEWSIVICRLRFLVLYCHCRWDECMLNAKFAIDCSYLLVARTILHILATPWNMLCCQWRVAIITTIIIVIVLHISFINTLLYDNYFDSAFFIHSRGCDVGFASCCCSSSRYYTIIKFFVSISESLFLVSLVCHGGLQGTRNLLVNYKKEFDAKYPPAFKITVFCFHEILDYAI